MVPGSRSSEPSGWQDRWFGPAVLILRKFEFPELQGGGVQMCRMLCLNFGPSSAAHMSDGADVKDQRCSSLTSVAPQTQKADSRAPQDHSAALCVFLPQCMLGGAPLHLGEKRTRPGNKSRSTCCSSKRLQPLRVITIPKAEDQSRIPIKEWHLKMAWAD